MKKIIVAAAVSSLLVGALGAEMAQSAPKPDQNVSRLRHPNIQEAQALAAKAFEKISAAQRANEFDLNGHAAKAKELLDQVSNELKQAALTANKNAR